MKAKRLQDVLRLADDSYLDSADEPEQEASPETSMQLAFLQAMDQQSRAIADAVSSNSQAVATLAASIASSEKDEKKPTAWHFKVVKRDGDGNVVDFIATPII
jgi:hypothetical protein